MRNIILEPVLDILLPSRCLLCNQDISEKSLCKACASLCNACPIGNFIRVKEQPGALFYYELAMRELLKKAKFGRSFSHTRLLFDLIEQNLSHNDLLAKLKDFSFSGVSYVPTHWMRRIFRGLDVPSMFAQVLAKKLGVPLVHSLQRTMFTIPQSSLHKKSERLQAVLGLYKIKRSLKAYERLLLVDDIVTTGATFDAASKALACACKEIRCLAIAKTP